MAAGTIDPDSSYPRRVEDSFDSARSSHDNDRHDLLSDEENDIEKHDDDIFPDGTVVRRRRTGICFTITVVVLSLFTFFAVAGVLIAWTTPLAPPETHNEPAEPPSAPVDVNILPTALPAIPTDIVASPTHAFPETTGILDVTTDASIIPTPTTTPTSDEPQTEDAPTQEPQDAQLSEATRNEEDYILDSAWDFQAAPQRREFNWTISDARLNPDGVFRPMIVINGKFPGPLIESNEGDTITVHVDNRGVNATAIHWHGLFQNSTNHMDGTVGITQCAIASGQTFTYEFQVSGQTGSYWYHGHVGLQASDGIFGPLIVHSKDEAQLQKLEYATDRVIMVQDYYHDLSGDLLMEYLSPDRENEEPIPNGALINGKNIRDCSDFPHRECDNSTASQSVINLVQGQSHRLRFINVGAFAEFQVQFDEHQFAVTEVDGTDVEPVYYHRLNIAAAQRYSIILTANVATAHTYWMRARMISHCFRGDRPIAYEEEIRAIVQYTAPNQTTTQAMKVPTSLDWPEAIELTCKDMNSTELIPVIPIEAPAEPDAFLYLRANFMIGNWRLDRGFFNESSWRPNPRSPTLYRAIDGLSMANESFETSLSATVNNVAFDINRELVVQTTGIQTIDVVIQNFDDGTHPMHLHGHKFFVLAHGQGHFNAETVYPSLNLTNPLRRDTATVDSYGWLLIRFVADNPGSWALHCHNSWHTEAGLLMQILSRSEIVRDWEIPVDAQSLCQATGVELGMAPSDDIWFGFGIGRE